MLMQAVPSPDAKSEASTAGGAALHSVAAFKAAAGAAVAEYFVSGQVNAVCTACANAPPQQASTQGVDSSVLRGLQQQPCNAFDCKASATCYRWARWCGVWQSWMNPASPTSWSNLCVLCRKSARLRCLTPSADGAIDASMVQTSSRVCSTRRLLRAESGPHAAHNSSFLRQVVTTAMDRKDREREAASVLLANLHPKMISQVSRSGPGRRSFGKHPNL